MINGVIHKQLKMIKDERGFLFEILRTDWPEYFKKFGQAYITCCYPGWVKGWHYHKIQYDNFCCVRGEVKVILVDFREKCETYREVNEFVLKNTELAILQIPPYVLHRFECVSETESWILNLPTELYNYKNQDEYRIALNSPEIPYDLWRDKKGY